MKRQAIAVWNGTIKEGQGRISTQSGVITDSQYSFGSRFEEGVGTNPEELIAAAHAGCFSMKLSADLGAAGFTPDQIETKAKVSLENGAVTRSVLTMHASVPGISDKQFHEIAEGAKTNCPVSKALNMEIELVAHLNS